MGKGISNHTQSQLVLAALMEYTQEHGYPPSIMDMANLIGKGRATVAYHLAWLERQGWLTHEAGKDRTWRVVHQVIEDDGEIERPALT